jgi:hypothetical protein
MYESTNLERWDLTTNGGWESIATAANCSSFSHTVKTYTAIMLGVGVSGAVFSATQSVTGAFIFTLPCKDD